MSDYRKLARAKPLGKRQKQILELVKDMEQFSVVVIVERLNVEYQTIWYSLQGLINRGQIERIGKREFYRYVKTEE